MKQIGFIGALIYIFLMSFVIALYGAAFTYGGVTMARVLGVDL